MFPGFRLVLSWFLALLSATGYPADVAPKQPAQRVVHRPWVWEARKGASTFHLAGCLHLGTAQEAALFAAYLPYFDQAPAVYFEVMPGAWETTEARQLWQRHGFVPARALLPSRLSTSAWQQVKARLEPALIARLLPMEPWLASLTVSQEGYRRAGLTAENGLDAFLSERSLRLGKPVGALEKPKDQILALASAPRADQERSLLGALQNYQRPGLATGAIRAAWRSGDLAGLQAALGVHLPQGAAITHENLLARRNAQWMRKIESLTAAGKSALLVIGVEHLVTEPAGLPALLARAGFRVRRVEAPPPGRPTPARRS